ncbi:MAG: MHYT domain-containing protein, partial [Dongia sp.]
MLQVYTCITQYHDLRLVLLAAVICFLCAYTSYSVVGRAVEAGPRARIWWLGAGAVATGSGIWATHFVAILAYEPGLPMSFDVTGTVLSIVIAILISGIGFAISMMRRIGLPALGGAVIGAGIGAMHYTGM